MPDFSNLLVAAAEGDRDSTAFSDRGMEPGVENEQQTIKILFHFGSCGESRPAMVGFLSRD